MIVLWSRYFYCLLHSYSFNSSDVESPIPAGGISLTTTLRNDGTLKGNVERETETKTEETEVDRSELKETLIERRTSSKILFKCDSIDRVSITARDSPMQSVSSLDQQLSQQQLLLGGKNKEYFDNLQSCYDPENIAISPSPLTPSR